MTVGLVLSGGGAKGIAEIGVIQALEDNDIPIDYITGTSMGAIVGGLYACGYTPDEMMELILSPGFASWSTGKITPADIYYFNNPRLTPEILKINLLSKSDSLRSILPSSLISPIPMNFAFMELFAAYSAQCGNDFNNLFVPFRCMTSDVYAKHKVMLAKGDLGDAVRASMSFPTVFQPIMIDGFLAFDGGIYDNFPVGVMLEEFKPDIVLGVDVSGPNTRPPEYDLFAQLEDMIMQKSDYNVPPEAGIRIKVDTHGTTLLEFPKARIIYQYGYDKAMEMMDSIKLRVKSRISKEKRTARRNKFKSETPKIVFKDVSVVGGTPKQNEYIEYLFKESHKDTFNIEQARASYYQAVTTGRLRNLVPRASYDDKTGLFDINMKATVRDDLHVGVGGYITSSVNSMLYLDAGYSTLSLNSLEANIGGWLGQSYMAADLNGRIHLATHTSSALTIEGVVNRTRLHQNDEIFFEDNKPVFITNLEIFGRGGYEWAMGNHGIMNVFAGYGYIRDNYATLYPTLNQNGSHYDKLKHYLGELGVGGSFYTLDNKMNPTAGHEYKFKAMGVLGHYDSYVDETHSSLNNVTAKWLQLEMNLRQYWNLHKNFSFGVEANLMASTRKLMPNYDMSIVSAFAFNPTASSYNSFHSSMRAMSYVTAGITPIIKFTDSLQLRLTGQYFLPFREIKCNQNLEAYYGDWFKDPKLFAEASLSYNFPFATLSGYVNYIDSPGRKWNCGLSFGLFFLAPQFLR